MPKTKTETPAERSEREAAEAYEAEANQADEREYLLSEMTPVDVKVSPVPMSALAVRFDPADLDRLRARAEADGVGVTQLVRAWVLERLDDDDQLPAAASEAFTVLRRVIKRGASNV